MMCRLCDSCIIVLVSRVVDGLDTPAHDLLMTCVCVAQQETKSKKKGKKGSKGSKAKGQGGAKVNIDKIGLLLDMIKEADVTSEENLAENETLVQLEGEH